MKTDYLINGIIIQVLTSIFMLPVLLTISAVPILIYFVISIIIWLIFIFNPVLGFYKYRNKVIVNSDEFPSQDLGWDINKFISIYNELKMEGVKFEIYFERSIKKRNRIVAIFEYCENKKRICEIDNLRLLEKYRNIWWCYQKDQYQK